MDITDSDLDIFPLEELSLREDSATSTETDSHSITHLTSFARKRLQISKAPKKSFLKSSRTFRILSLVLHCILIGIHFALIVVWAMGLEHRLMVSQERAAIISLLVTATTTTFGAIYLALLVFITQTLSMRHDLHIHQSLTATHDNAAAWAGLGSAVFCLWYQKSVPASVRGVLLALLYLGSIAILHITLPNMFFLQTVQNLHPVVVGTRGLPFDPHALAVTTQPCCVQMLPAILGNVRREGLHEGSLYDVLDDNAGTGNVIVDATGFNVTCRFFPQAHRIPLLLTPDGEGRTVVLDSTDKIIGAVPSTTSNIISTFQPFINDSFGRWDYNIPDSVFIYATVPVVDSSGASAPWLDFPQPAQVFRCFQSLVKQTAVIDAKSREVLEITPKILKTSSTWSPFEPGLDILTSGNFLIDRWGCWYSSAPASEFRLARSTAPPFQYGHYLSVADLYLIQKFNLAAAEVSERPSDITLHDLENVLSTIVATMFWTMGHVLPAHGFETDVMAQLVLLQPPVHTSLLKGNATVSEIVTETHLTLNVVAVVIGLTVTIVLGLVSLRYSFFHIPRDRKDLIIDGTGILHTIWLYRNQPKLQTILKQAGTPTNNNLREAGMVNTTFGGQLPGAEPSNLIDLNTDALSFRGESTTGSAVDANTNLLNSARTGLPVQKTSLLSSRSLRFLSLLLHLTLVAIHLGLICICVMGPEHRLVVSLAHQGLASFLVTVMTTTFTTIYSALLVLNTQTLSMRRDLQIHQTLTATHDNAAAWAGLGSAALYIWNQRDVSASLRRVLLAFFYLGNIALLQVAMSSMFAMQTVTVPHSVPVATQSLPSYPSSYIGYGSRPSDAWIAFAQGALHSLPLILSNASTEGLYNGTLYDVPGANAGTGNITVDATGFNITCRLFPEARTIPTDWLLEPQWKVELDSKDKVFGSIRPAARNIISHFNSMDDDANSGSLLIYATLPIVDSQDIIGPSVNFTRPYVDPFSSVEPRPMLNFTQPVQLFRCSQLLVNQIAVLDAESRKVVDIQPSIHKTSSTWLPFALSKAAPNGSTIKNSFIDAWARWYEAMPNSNFARVEALRNWDYVSVADLYLIQRFNLCTVENSQRASNVTLHDLENALSIIVAAMFWTLGHVLPLHGLIVEGTDEQVLNAAIEGPILLEGVATVHEMVTEACLDLNIISVLVGLATSIALSWISLQYSVYHGVPRHAEDVTVDGVGILHTIWLYRNERELEGLLKQVEYPTNKNLRKAGMVDTTFGGQLRKRGDGAGASASPRRNVL
ncbi:hypothetical protein MSAN_00822400 [Mycena sanguinolenta]|uniref:Uncharacterized protein n=1 Tax=Mycena sanguinolenta TaxID=230812 RepID=A0A8H6YZE7_9AGAR|nr:hypothetical protein MSAN_00822400 [Mycena sanguinolenta]